MCFYVKNMKIMYKEFNVAKYLDNEEIITEYLSAAAEDKNTDVFFAALDDVTKARKQNE